MISHNKRIIIDANTSRFKEGARVLEDLSRFILQDPHLFKKIKDLKQSIKFTTPINNVEEDIGGPKFKENNTRKNLFDLVHANAFRMQEAARVLEEIYNNDFYKKIRFLSYEIHSEITSKLRAYLNLDKMTGIYAICDFEINNVEEIYNTILGSDISICQIRSKSLSKRQMIKHTRELKQKLGDKTIVIVNDDLDVALSCADGVHLGQNDFPINEARNITHENFIIGASVHSLDEALHAIHSGANYISVGCLFPTNTKQDTTPVSLKTLEKIVSKVNIPVCAIGGINNSNIDMVLQHNPDMIAVHSAIWKASDTIKAAKSFTNLITHNS